MWMISGLDLNQKTLNDRTPDCLSVYPILSLWISGSCLRGREADLILTGKNSGDQKAAKWPDCLSPPPPVHTLTSKQGNEYREGEKITAWNYWEGRIFIGESIRVALKLCAITFERLTTFFVWSLPKSSSYKKENGDSGHEQLHWEYITEFGLHR